MRRGEIRKEKKKEKKKDKKKKKKQLKITRTVVFCAQRWGAGPESKIVYYFAERLTSYIFHPEFVPFSCRLILCPIVNN